MSVRTARNLQKLANSNDDNTDYKDVFKSNKPTPDWKQKENDETINKSIQNYNKPKIPTRPSDDYYQGPEEFINTIGRNNSRQFRYKPPTPVPPNKPTTAVPPNYPNTNYRARTYTPKRGGKSKKSTKGKPRKHKKRTLRR